MIKDDLKFAKLPQIYNQFGKIQRLIPEKYNNY